MREWNFERFFPERSSLQEGVGKEGFKDEKNNLAFAEKKKIEEMNNKLKLENRVKNAIFTRNNFNSPQNQKLLAENSPKRPENDSRFSNFVRGFRRENTDFFPLSKRHSAIFGGEQQSPVKNNSPQKTQRSSAIFQRNRPKGEPVLTDFIPKRDNTLDNKAKISNETNTTASGANRNSEVKLRHPTPSNNVDLHRMRREKTESVIFVSSRNSNALNSNAESFQQLHQVKDLRIARLINASLQYFLDTFIFFMLIFLFYFLSLKHVPHYKKKSLTHYKLIH